MPVTEKIGKQKLILRSKTLGDLPWEVEVNWVAVDSSNIKRVGWDVGGNTYVEFHHDGIYCYVGTSIQKAVACAYAQSTGEYFARKIKGVYPYVKIKVGLK